MDPLSKTYPHLTPYQFASNTPIQAIDIDGLEGIIFHVKQFQVGETFFQTTDVEYLNNDDGRILYMVHDLDAQTITEIWQDPVNIRYEPSFTEKLLTGILAVHNAQMAVNNYIMDTPNRMDGLKARMTGGWENYGEGENWVKSAGFNINGSVGVGKHSVGFDLSTYSNSENNISFQSSVYYEIDVSVGVDKNGLTGTLTDFTPKASLSGSLWFNTESSSVPEAGYGLSSKFTFGGEGSYGGLKVGGNSEGQYNIGLTTSSTKASVGASYKKEASATSRLFNLSGN